MLQQIPKQLRYVNKIFKVAHYLLWGVALFFICAGAVKIVYDWWKSR